MRCSNSFTTTALSTRIVVCPSVRLSITLVYCIKTARNVEKLFSFKSTGALNKHGFRKFTICGQYLAASWKWHVVVRIRSIRISFDDLE